MSGVKRLFLVVSIFTHSYQSFLTQNTQAAFLAVTHYNDGFHAFIDSGYVYIAFWPSIYMRTGYVFLENGFQGVNI